MARLISKIYGKALFDFAVETKQVEKMYEEALDIVDVFTNSDDVENFLAEPKITEEEKLNFLNDLFLKKIWQGENAKSTSYFKLNVNKGENPKILDFIAIVIEKGRQKDIVPILEYYIHATLKNKNIGEAEVVSVNELSEDKKEALKKKLIAITDYNDFIIDYKLDESLIAGMKIKIDDKVFDKTYKTKIFDITKSLRGLKL